MAKPVVALRKPPEVETLKTSETFVFGNADAEGSKTPRPKPVRVAGKKGRGIVLRASGREVRRLVVYLPPDLAKKLSVHCFESEQELSEVVTDAVGRFLDQGAG